jgi:hypothetical protein
MSDEHLPLGYLVPDEVLVQYAQNHTNHKMLDEDFLAWAQCIALVNTNADRSHVRWANSDSSSGIPLVIYLQISGGGPHEWRIPKVVEDRLCADL